MKQPEPQDPIRPPGHAAAWINAAKTNRECEHATKNPSPIERIVDTIGLLKEIKDEIIMHIRRSLS